MKIQVEMSKEEFLEFTQWQGDRNKYQAENEKLRHTSKVWAVKIDAAVEQDPKKPGKYKIVDHEHMDDLYLMAGDALEEEAIG